VSEDRGREGRQRELVLAAIERYRAGRSSLRRVAEDLQALAPEFPAMPAAWQEELQSEVNNLDVTFAVAIDRDVADALPEESVTEVAQTLDRIERLMVRLPIGE
jgi:hypothetical protein